MSTTDTIRAAFEAWMQTRPGYPFAGSFANLMWASWQAATEAAKATGTAGEQDALREQWARVDAEIGGKAMHVAAFDDGVNVAEAARQPEPVVACAMQAARDIEHERLRQHWQEGWTNEKDDQYVEGELSRAAACYASHASAQQRMKVPEAAYQATEPLPQNYFGWPWDKKWWKPQNPRRDLVKAGALILAEIERLDRAATNRSQP